MIFSPSVFVDATTAVVRGLLMPFASMFPKVFALTLNAIILQAAANSSASTAEIIGPPTPSAEVIAAGQKSDKTTAKTAEPQPEISCRVSSSASESMLARPISLTFEQPEVRIPYYNETGSTVLSGRLEELSPGQSAADIVLRFNLSLMGDVPSRFTVYPVRAQAETDSEEESSLRIAMSATNPRAHIEFNIEGFEGVFEADCELSTVLGSQQAAN